MLAAMWKRLLAVLYRFAVWATPIMNALAGLPGLNGTAERHDPKDKS